jgi:hypothetical protein
MNSTNLLVNERHENIIMNENRRRTDCCLGFKVDIKLKHVILLPVCHRFISILIVAAIFQPHNIRLTSDYS